MAHTTDYAARFQGVAPVNLVDFDMLYGHRRDIDGYAAALTEFDRWLGTFLPTLGEDDVVMITADHGCDPSYTATTDHTREYVPLLVLGKGVKPGNLGTKATFAGHCRHRHRPAGRSLGRRGHEFRGRNTVSTILRKT